MLHKLALLGWIIFVAVLSALGCASEPALPNVSGVATVDGKPLPLGTITFYPDKERGNNSLHQPVGLIEEGGHFSLTVPGSRKGAPLGWYKVVVYAVDNPQPGKPNRYFTHKKYSDLATTPLRAEVVATPEPGRYDLKLDR
jgi:hypothetical protein